MEKRKAVVFNRSPRGNKTKFDEALKILEYSVMLVEFFDLKEFNNVIAGQLRLILCDTSIRRKGGKNVILDNSLIHKINFRPTLHTVNDFIELDQKGSAVVPGEALFNYNKPKIDLKQWLNQVIYKLNLEGILHEITIFEFIKGAANKGGGAHVDSSLPEKSLLIDVHAETVLRHIAKELFRSLGRDFEKQSTENLTYMIETFTQKVSH